LEIGLGRHTNLLLATGGGVVTAPIFGVENGVVYEYGRLDTGFYRVLYIVKPSAR